MTDERKKLVKKLDEVVREICRKRDKSCVTCGSTEALQCSHLIGRNRKTVRWNLVNVNMQCSRCHCYHHNQSEQRYTRWFIAHYGLIVYDDLVKLSEQVDRRTIYELYGLLEDLERMI